jgi:hypothetical protein
MIVRHTVVEMAVSSSKKSKNLRCKNVTNENESMNILGKNRNRKL